MSLSCDQDLAETNSLYEKVSMKQRKFWWRSVDREWEMAQK